MAEGMRRRGHGAAGGWARRGHKCRTAAHDIYLMKY